MSRPSVPPSPSAPRSDHELGHDSTQPQSVDLSERGSSKSVPAASIQDRATRPQDASAQPQLPHERDESVDMTADEPCAVMQQAHKDIERGLQDTDQDLRAHKVLKGDAQ